MKKLVTLALSCLLICGMAVGCNKKTETVKEEQQNAAVDENYMNSYGELYNTNLGGLAKYDVYTNLESAQNAFKDKHYPGNKEYLAEVRTAYEDSRDKIQTFIDGLKSDVTTKNEDINKKNEELIKEGEKLVKEIDRKIAKLDEIKDKDFEKDQSEFIKLVYDKTKEGESETNEFTKKIKEMNEQLGINVNTAK